MHSNCPTKEYKSFKMIAPNRLKLLLATGRRDMTKGFSL
jgi:hypothetical protein